MRGYDGGKKIKGRKRHIIVDTMGNVVRAFVTEANIGDRAVAQWLLPWIVKHFPRVKKIWADQGYTGDFVEQATTNGIDVEIKPRDPTQRGFHVIPWRWVVERTFGWLNLYRRLSKDYEYWVYTADAMIYATMSRLLVRRLARLRAEAS